MDVLAPVSAREVDMRKKAVLNTSLEQYSHIGNVPVLQPDGLHVDSGFVGEFGSSWNHSRSLWYGS